jgi:hypothetical protein
MISSEAHNFQISLQMNDMKGSPDFSSLSSIGPSARTSWASQGDFQISCSLVAAIVVGMFDPFFSDFFSEEYLFSGDVRMGKESAVVYPRNVLSSSHVAISR